MQTITGQKIWQKPFNNNGASELVQMSLHALINNGDEVLALSPDYPQWTLVSTSQAARLMHYICDEQSEWYPDPAALRRPGGGRC